VKTSYTGLGSRKGGDGGNLGILSREPVIAANLGMGELIKTVVPARCIPPPKTTLPPLAPRPGPVAKSHGGG